MVINADEYDRIRTIENGHIKPNINSGSHVHPFVPGQGETFDEAKTRYSQLIKEEDVAHWHEHGFVVVKNFLAPEEIKRLNGAIDKHMPRTWEEYSSKKLIYQNLAGSSGRNVPGSTAAAVRYDFPYADDALNDLAVHPFLLAFAERLAGTDDLALSLGHLVGKYSGRDYDQSLHSDYSNNSLVVPQKSKAWIDIPMIVYLTDVTIDLGPTYVVSQKHTEPRKLIEDGFRFHTREQFPELYEVEQPFLAPAGSVVIYSMRTFHRGSAMLSDQGCRIVQFTGYHTANIPWMAPMDQQHQMGTPEMDRFLIHADPRQRQIIGFPPVDHPYWKDPDAVEGVANRYPKMDMRPYGGGPPKRFDTSACKP